jgi:hypothetical protein
MPSWWAQQPAFVPTKQKLRMGEPAKSQWKVHWKVPFLMTLFYCLAFLLAAGHHFYYQHLDGKFPPDQDVGFANSGFLGNERADRSQSGPTESEQHWPFALGYA